MKHILFTFSISIFTLSSCFSQKQVQQENKVKKVSEMHDLYKDIEARSIKYDKVEKDILEESSEGGTVTGYYNNGKLKKISAEIFGEMGKVHSNYYLNNDGSLFFVLNQTYSYNKPIYIEGSETKNVEEEEYYYDGNKLLKWVKSKGEQQMDVPEFKNEEKRFFGNFNHYKIILGDYGKVPGTTVISDTGSSTKQYKIKDSIKIATILSINKNRVKDDDEFRTPCENWTLDQSAIIHIASLAKQISSHDFMYLFNVLPCEIRGTILVGGTKYDYVINAGSFMKLSTDDKTYYYDCSNKDCEKYFLSKGGNPTRGLGQ